MARITYRNIYLLHLAKVRTLVQPTPHVSDNSGSIGWSWSRWWTRNGLYIHPLNGILREDAKRHSQRPELSKNVALENFGTGTSNNNWLA